MSVEFFRQDGVIWMRAQAGGVGGGVTSMVVRPANDDDLQMHFRQHAALLAQEREEAAAAEAAKPRSRRSRTAPDVSDDTKAPSAE